MRGVYIVSSRTRAAYKVGKHHGTMAALLARYKTALSDPLVELFVETPHHGAAESSILATLDTYRTRDMSGRKTEWIDLPLTDVKQIVADIAGKTPHVPHAYSYLLGEITTARDYEALTGVQLISIPAGAGARASATYARINSIWREFTQFPQYAAGCTKCGLIMPPHSCGGIVTPVRLDQDKIISSSIRDGYFITRGDTHVHARTHKCYFTSDGATYEATIGARPRKLGKLVIVLDAPVVALPYSPPAGKIPIPAPILAGFGAFCRDFFGGAASIFEDSPARLLTDALLTVAAAVGAAAPHVADLTAVTTVADYNARVAELACAIVVSPFVKYTAAAAPANIIWYIWESLKK